MVTMMMAIMTSIWLSSSLSTVRDVFPSFSYKLCRPHLYVEIVQFLKKIVMILMGLWLCVLCMCTKERHYDYLVYVVAYCSPHLLYTKNSSKWLLWRHPLDVCQLVTVPSSRAWSSQRYRGRCYNWIHNNFAINVLLPGSPNGWKTGAQPWASPPVQLWPTSRSSPVLMVNGWSFSSTSSSTCSCCCHCFHFNKQHLFQPNLRFEIHLKPNVANIINTNKTKKSN